MPDPLRSVLCAGPGRGCPRATSVPSAGPGVPGGVADRRRTTVLAVLHPVGPLPAAVYWRRRALVLGLVLAVVGGGGWLGTALLRSGPADGVDPVSASSSAAATTGAPVLERVVPSVAGVRTPTAPAPPTVVAPAAAAAQPGAPCSDDMIVVEVHGPGRVPAGSGPVLELAVTNSSAVPCVRVLDKELQEIVLLDGAGTRVWGSNDCIPEASDDVRTLAPGEVAVFPLVWSGRSSEPTCTVAREVPLPGDYSLRGRLDTAVSADTPLTLTG